MSSLFFPDNWSESNPHTEDDNSILIFAEYSIEPEACLKCGVIGEFYKHGKKSVKVVDTPMRGKTVAISLSLRRYKCNACTKSFMQPVNDMDSKRRMTTRCIEYIEKQSLRRTFAQVAEDIGIDEKGVRTITYEYIDRLNAAYKLIAPTTLGIDEIYLIGKPRAVFTDIDRGELIDFLPNRNKDLIVNWLSNLPYKHHVKYVAIDMWIGYKTAVNAVLPNAQVVIDKFHVVRLANYAVDTIRKAQQAKLTKKGRVGYKRGAHILRKRPKNLSVKQAFALDGWLKNDEVIASAYNAKEQFYEIFDNTDRAAAEACYDTWKAGLEGDTETAFASLVKSMDNWRSEIFALFDTGVTNAFTESYNNLIRSNHRQGRGYSFEVIRARMMYGRGLRPSYKCFNCKGLFDKSELAHHTEREPLLLCQVCSKMMADTMGELMKDDPTFPAPFYTGAKDDNPTH